MQARTYNFLIKIIPSGFNILLGKIKDSMFLFLYHVFGLHFPEAIKH